jgi:hypothetical protein
MNGKQLSSLFNSPLYTRKSGIGVRMQCLFEIALEYLIPISLIQ